MGAKEIEEEWREQAPLDAEESVARGRMGGGRRAASNTGRVEERVGSVAMNSKPVSAAARRRGVVL